MLLQLRDIQKSFNDQPVLRHITLTLEAGEILALLGPSGCGKTTLLRIIAGLETADRGRLLYQGRDLTQIPVHARHFGLVFQDYALFPHKNVQENVAFGLRMQNWPPAQIQARVREVLTLVGLAAFGPRPIYELSGGEQQRVALARSLAPAPRLILLDEPLGALDRALRERLMLELRDILKRAGGLLQPGEEMTAVYVTHDQAEAFAIADRVVVLNNGRIEQIGSPIELYRQPRTPFVARFLGMENILEGELLSTEPLVVRTALGDLHLTEAPDQPPRAACTLLIRPDAARLLTQKEAALNEVHGRLQDVSFRGRYQIATVLAEGGVSLKLELETAVALPPLGAAVTLALDAQRLHLLESGKMAG